MRVTRLFAGCPAPVAPLPPQVSPRSATFSMARSETFSTAIDSAIYIGAAFHDVLDVSPGSRPRPSLSDRDQLQHPGGGIVSPGSRPRPSLSADLVVEPVAMDAGVAGVSAPAFVER